MLVLACGLTASAANTVTFNGGTPKAVAGLKVQVNGTSNPDTGWNVSYTYVKAEQEKPGPKGTVTILEVGATFYTPSWSRDLAMSENLSTKVSAKAQFTSGTLTEFVTTSTSTVNPLIP